MANEMSNDRLKNAARRMAGVDDQPTLPGMGDTMTFEEIFDEYRPTPAQRVMREEMTAGKCVDHLLGGPKPEDVDMEQLALDIIARHPSLTLSLDQWQLVQHMIQQGIATGYGLQGPVAS